MEDFIMNNLWKIAGIGWFITMVIFLISHAWAVRTPPKPNKEGYEKRN